MDLRSSFETDGFIVLDDAFDEDSLQAFEDAIIEYGRRAAGDLGLESVNGSRYDLLRSIERTDKGKFYGVCTHPGTSVGAFAVTTSPRLRETLTEITGRPAEGLYPSPITLFWNERQVERLHYDWHQESSYYPGKKVSLHCWFPVFRDISSEDGPMIVCKGSHHRQEDYVEERGQQAVTQKRVSEEVASRYEQFECAIPRGAAILFHQNLIHKTSENRNDLPRTSGVIRFFDLVADDEYVPVLVNSV